MKIMYILVLLVTTSTISHAQAQPAANQVERVHRPICKDPKNEKYLCACCICTGASLVACCVYSIFFMSDESRMHGQIQSLQNTSTGPMIIKYFKEQGAREAYQKGLIDGQIKCPKHSPQEMLRDDAYQPCFCLDLTVQRILKKNN